MGEANTPMTTGTNALDMVRERDESGRFQETVSKDGIMDLFDEVDGPAITSRDASDKFDCTAEAARKKLNELVDDGRLRTRKIGRTRLYWKDGGSE